MSGPVLPALVQNVGINFATTVTSMAPSLTGVVAGNCLVLVVSSTTITSGYVASAVSDSGTTSSGIGWTRLVVSPGATFGTTEIWAANNVAAGTHTVTVTTTSGTNACELMEFSGVSATPLVVDSVFSTTNSSTLTPSNVTNLIVGSGLANTANSMNAFSGLQTAVNLTSSGTAINTICYGAFINTGLSANVFIFTPSCNVAQINLRTNQPVGPTVWNDPSSSANTAVLTQQACPDYLDEIIDVLPGLGYGVNTGFSVYSAGNIVGGTVTFAGVQYSNGNGLFSTQTSTANSSGNPRRDLIYLTLIGGTITANIAIGTPSSQPAVPLLPQGAIPLAVVDMPNGAASGSADFTTNTATGKITDKRPIMTAPLTSLRDATLFPSQQIETHPRWAAGTTATLTSGTLALAAVILPDGFTVGHITFTSVGAAGSPTHWWFGLYDLNRNQLAVTADQTSTAWAASTTKTLALATTQSGTRSTFTTTYSGLYYIGIMMVATTPITLVAGVATMAITSPSLYGPSDTSQTTPPAFPHTATSIGAASVMAYAYVGV